MVALCVFFSRTYASDEFKSWSFIFFLLTCHAWSFLRLCSREWFRCQVGAQRVFRGTDETTLGRRNCPNYESTKSNSIISLPLLRKRRRTGFWCFVFISFFWHLIPELHELNYHKNPENQAVTSMAAFVTPIRAALALRRLSPLSSCSWRPLSARGQSGDIWREFCAVWVKVNLSLYDKGEGGYQEPVLICFVLRKRRAIYHLRLMRIRHQNTSRTYFDKPWIQHDTTCTGRCNPHLCIHSEWFRMSLCILTWQHFYWTLRAQGCHDFLPIYVIRFSFHKTVLQIMKLAAMHGTLQHVSLRGLYTWTVGGMGITSLNVGQEKVLFSFRRFLISSKLGLSQKQRFLTRGWYVILDALRVVAISQNTRALRILAHLGATIQDDPDKLVKLRDPVDNTALHLAANRNNDKVVQLLCDKKAHPEAAWQGPVWPVWVRWRSVKWFLYGCVMLCESSTDTSWHIMNVNVMWSKI